MPMSKDFEKRLFPKIKAIADHFGTPFQLDDELGIRQNLRRFNNAFTSLGINFTNFYAVKANPLQAIADIVMEEGGGFDCSSIPELRMARFAGAGRNGVMFTSNNTSQSEYFEALSQGGCILNLDDDSFVDKVPDPLSVNLFSFRLNPGKLKTGGVNSIIGDPINSKYGVPIPRAIKVYGHAAERFRTRRCGIHLMAASNELRVEPHVDTAKIVLDFAGKLIKKKGLRPEFINCGGGIGTPYKPGVPDFDLDTYAQRIAGLLDTFEKEFEYKPRFYLECGRYVTGPHGVLVNRVINVYNKWGRNYVGVEVAMPALMRPAMYGAYHHITVLDKNGRVKKGPTKIYHIVGPICENCDRLGKRRLPIIEEGDYIMVHNTGAHAIAMGFTYNMRTRPQTLLDKEDGTVIRTSRAETYDDLIVRQQGLGGSKNILRLGKN